MKRPNILFIHTDQQRWDALRANGNSHIRTPNLDRLAARGTNFSAHFVQNPVCMPSRISLLTGQYPSTLGLQHMAVPVPEDTLTLPRILGRWGYQTAVIGKLHFLPHACRDHRIPHPAYGFDHLEVSDEPGCYEDAYYHWVKRRAPDQIDQISLGLPPAAERWRRTVGFADSVTHPPEGRLPLAGGAFRAGEHLTHSAFVGEQTENYIREHAGGPPFFCFAGFYAPHSPFVAPQRFLDLYDPAELPLPRFPETVEQRRRRQGPHDAEIRACIHGYYAMISEVDEQVGRLLACLDDCGIAENTLVVFTSDHGEWLGEHLRFGKGYPPADCISRTPLIVCDPREPQRQGRTVSEIVEAIDVVPTLLARAAIPLPPHLQGRDLFASDSPRPENEQLAVTEMTGWKALRVPGWRYILRADGEELLFDLQNDPGEYHNLAADAKPDPEVLRRLADLRRRLLRRCIQAERPRPRTWAY